VGIGRRAAKRLGPAPQGVTRAGLNQLINGNAKPGWGWGLKGKGGLTGAALIGTHIWDKSINTRKAKVLQDIAALKFGDPATAKQVGDEMRAITGRPSLTDDVISSLLGNDIPEEGLMVPVGKSPKGQKWKRPKVTKSQRSAALTKLRQLLED
jgi:hypothetical protein